MTAFFGLPYAPSEYVTWASYLRGVPICGPLRSYVPTNLSRVKLNGASDVRVVQRSGLEVVVLGQRVGEAVAVDDQLAALGLEELPGGEGHQHDDQRDVEHQVPGLAQIALLGGDRIAVRVRPEAPLAHDRERGLADLLGLGVGAPRRVRGQPGQPLRGARRPAAQLADELAGARHDAADEGDEQQDVDRGEPHRAVDVEELELLVDRRDGGVGFLEGLHLQLVHAVLRDQRAGDGPEREQEEQDQRDPHRGELAPEPARPADDAHGGQCGQGFFARAPWRAASRPRRARPRSPAPVGSRARARRRLGRVGLGVAHGTQIPTVKPLDQPCSSCIMLLHTPVSRSRPVTIIIAPPIRMTHT